MTKEELLDIVVDNFVEKITDRLDELLEYFVKDTRGFLLSVANIKELPPLDIDRLSFITAILENAIKKLGSIDKEEFVRKAIEYNKDIVYDETIIPKIKEWKEND